MNKNQQDILFSSKKHDHETPKDLFKQLNKEFHFTHDVAATEENSLCANFLTEVQNALVVDWGYSNWCNPPYGRGIIEWVKQANFQFCTFKSTTVMLLPSRTDTKWFHLAMEACTEVRFIKGRLKFGGLKDAAPFPSLLLIWEYPRIKIDDYKCDRDDINNVYTWKNFRVN